jgi:hypothetical protein
MPLRQRIPPTRRAASVPVRRSGTRVRHKNMPSSRCSSNHTHLLEQRPHSVAMQDVRAIRDTHVHLRSLRLENHFSRSANKDRSPSLGLSTWIRALRGGNTSTILFHKLLPKGAATSYIRIMERKRRPRAGATKWPATRRPRTRRSHGSCPLFNSILGACTMSSSHGMRSLTPLYASNMMRSWWTFRGFVLYSGRLTMRLVSRKW